MAGEYEERMHRVREEARQKAVIEFWDNNCPEIYRRNDPSRAACPVEAAKVVGWQFGGKGLLLVGPSRAGKTHSVWTLLRRIAMEKKSIATFDGLSWFTSVSRSFSDLTQTDAFFNTVTGVDLLFLDDIFLGRITDAQIVGIWGTVERRMQAAKPTIVTTNATGQTLIDRCGAAIVPVIERLRECCEVVSFTK